MIVFAFLLLITLSFGVEIHLRGAITDICVGNKNVAIATELGNIYLLDKGTLSVKTRITFPEFTDFMGEKQKPKVFSVDISPSGKRILAVVESDLGKRDVYIYENGKLIKVLKLTDVSKGKFLDENRIILGTIGDEVWLYDLSKRKTVYRYLVFRFVFSDFDFNENKTLIAWGDESGKVFFIDPNSGKVIGVGTEGNKDKIFKLDFAKNRVIAGGRDKKAVVYNLNSKEVRKTVWKERLDAPSLLKNVQTQFVNRKLEFLLFPEKVFETNFMVFAVALSPNEKYGAFVSDEKGNVKVFKPGFGVVQTFNPGCYVNVLKFMDDKRLLIGCIDGTLKVKEVKP